MVKIMVVICFMFSVTNIFANECFGLKLGPNKECGIRPDSDVTSVSIKKYTNYLGKINGDVFVNLKTNAIPFQFPGIDEYWLMIDERRMVYEIAGQITKLSVDSGYNIISQIKDSLSVWCPQYQAEVDLKDDYRISDGIIRAGVNLTNTGGLVFYWIDIAEYHQNEIVTHGLKPDSLNRGLFDFISGMTDHSIEVSKAKNRVIVMKEKDNLTAIQILPEYVVYSATTIYDPQNIVMVKKELGVMDLFFSTV